MIRTICVVVASMVFVACASAQTTKPSNLAEENSMLREHIKKLQETNDRLMQELRQMQAANESLDKSLMKEHEEIQRLQTRIASAPVVPFNQGLSLRGAPESVPPNWVPRKFNGMTYYLVPLSNPAMMPEAAGK